MGLDPTKPNLAAQQTNEAVQKKTKNLANGSTSNPDFANGKGDDPHARGAESSCDFIMNN